MSEVPEVECNHCGWQGSTSAMVCPEDEADLPVDECHFDRCPECESNDIDDYED